MEQPYTICYSSRSDPSLKDTEIQELFDQVIMANMGSGITTILLHSFGRIFQVLEGDEGLLQPLFTERIKEMEGTLKSLKYSTGQSQGSFLQGTVPSSTW